MVQTATTKVIGPAYGAVWAALKGWRQWTAPIVTYCDTDEARKRFLQMDANLSRCPMIAAQWDATEPKWWVYSQQEWLCPLRVSVFVQSDRNELSMALVEDVIDAVFRFEAASSTAAGPLPLVRSLTCRDPEILQFTAGQFIEVGQDGQHKLLQSDVVIRLSLRKDPKLRAS